MNTISSEKLGKVYNDGTQAIQDVNISCDSGHLYSVLGPNGAGKTTLLRILSTQLLPTYGKAKVLGFDVVKEAGKIRSQIAVVPQDAGSVSHMSAWQHVYWYLVSRGYTFSKAKKSAKKALELLDLWHIKDKPSIALSGGQRKRIIVAMALATDAEVLFLDEPTAGLDPLVRRNVWSGLREEVRNGRTILLTTHNMEEAEMLADHVFMVNKGKIVASANPSKLKTLLTHKFKVLLEGTKGVNEYRGYGEVLTIGDRVVVYLDDEERLRELILDVSRRDLTLSVRPIDLEDVFIKLVGERL